MIEIVTLDEFDKLLSEAEGPVICDFTATWCGPCKSIAPIFEKCSSMPECKHMTFVKIDVDVGEEIATRCNIAAMPTFQAYYKKQKVGEFSGAKVESLEALVNKCLVLHYEATFAAPTTGT